MATHVVEKKCTCGGVVEFEYDTHEPDDDPTPCDDPSWRETKIDECTGKVIDGPGFVDSVCKDCDGRGHVFRFVRSVRSDRDYGWIDCARSTRIRRQADILTDRIRVMSPCSKCDGRGTIPVRLA